jgi:aminopeptidase N
MASYLLSFTAGELERSTGSLGELDLGIVTTEGKSKNTGYAIASTKQILTYYNDYFGVDFPLPKLDQVAVPGGFSGAMENWGNIIYNESLLLHDTEKSTLSNKQEVYKVIAHEVAHQWFGNLVTMAWWDNLWLNEGFASWMGTKVTQHFNQDWRIDLQAHRDREEAMALDARATSHAIQTPIENESQAASAFDQITYLKGQSFLRMLEAYLGEQPFRQGLRAYMQEHKYSNATTADLWKALGKASGKPVAKLAADWTLQAGFPLVTVDATCQNKQRHITFTQQQFRADSDTPGERRWAIPVKLSYTQNGKAIGAGETLLLKEKTTKITRPGCDGALTLDPDSSGYFRVEYSEKLLPALSQQLPSLAPNVRLKLLSDTWALVGIKHQPLSAYFSLVSHLGNEPEANVWIEVIGKLASLDKWSQGQPIQSALREYAIHILQPKLKEIGWNAQAGEDVNQTVLRELLISNLGRFGDKEVIAEAKKRFQAMLLDPASLSPTLLDPVIGIVGKYADTAEFEALEKLAREAVSSEEKERYFSALFSVNDAKLAERTLKLSLDPSVPQMLAMMVLPTVAQADGHETMAWSFAKDNVDALLNRTTAFHRQQYLGMVATASSDPAMADELESFGKLHLPDDAAAETHKAAEIIRLKAKRQALFVPQIEAALAH